MPTGMHSASSKASLGAASMIAEIVRHWSEDNGREDSRRPCWRRQTARCECAVLGHALPGRRMQSMLPGGTSHYVFDPEFCNPAAGWEKGQVEKSVRDAPLSRMPACAAGQRTSPMAGRSCLPRPCCAE